MRHAGQCLDLLPSGLYRRRWDRTSSCLAARGLITWSSKAVRSGQLRELRSAGCRLPIVHHRRSGITPCPEDPLQLAFSIAPGWRLVKPGKHHGHEQARRPGTRQLAFSCLRQHCPSAGHRVSRGHEAYRSHSAASPYTLRWLLAAARMLDKPLSGVYDRPACDRSRPAHCKE